jgi:hypothetical protein|tara:strand:+ start:150 stop:695 length:546 start_codon:yes stop_codon:yes gene_type:complete
MSESFPPEVFNHDVLWVYDMLRRFHQEMARSQSAPVSGMIEADQIRLESYLYTMRTAIVWIQDTPLLDMPETHPRPYPLTPFPPEVDIENESLNVIIRLIRAAAVEMTNSQSARFSSRLQAFDQKRLTAVIDKIDAFLNNFIRANAVPLDLPESSPEEPLGGDGFLGVAGVNTASVLGGTR